MLSTAWKAGFVNLNQYFIKILFITGKIRVMAIALRTLCSWQSSSALSSGKRAFRLPLLLVYGRPNGERGASRRRRTWPRCHGNGTIVPFGQT
jgi:hypothetical protein